MSDDLFSRRRSGRERRRRRYRRAQRATRRRRGASDPRSRPVPTICSVWACQATRKSSRNGMRSHPANTTGRFEFEGSLCPVASGAAGCRHRLPNRSACMLARTTLLRKGVAWLRQFCAPGRSPPSRRNQAVTPALPPRRPVLRKETRAPRIGNFCPCGARHWWRRRPRRDAWLVVASIAALFACTFSAFPILATYPTTPLFPDEFRRPVEPKVIEPIETGQVKAIRATDGDRVKEGDRRRGA